MRNKTPACASALVRVSFCDEAHLFAQERLLVAAEAHAKRRAEFFAGRIAAHHAMKRLGVEVEPVLRVAETRIPLWPSGLCGSISHTSSCAIAVVGYENRYRALGVDIQTYRNLDWRPLAKRVCVGDEITYVKAHVGLEHQRVLELFSAKESVYKAVYPLVGGHLGFADIELRANPDGFLGTIMRDLPPYWKRGQSIAVIVDRRKWHVVALTLVSKS